MENGKASAAHQQLGGGVLQLRYGQAREFCGARQGHRHRNARDGRRLVRRAQQRQLLPRRLVRERGQAARRSGRSHRQSEGARAEIRHLVRAGNDLPGQRSLPCASGLVSPRTAPRQFHRAQPVCDRYVAQGCAGQHLRADGGDPRQIRHRLCEVGLQPESHRSGQRTAGRGARGGDLPSVRAWHLCGDGSADARVPGSAPRKLLRRRRSL